MPGPNINFVPVGPWNTNGLIIAPDELTKEQSQYVHDLLASRFPVIFTTPEGPGPIVAVDNALGIRQAFEHLFQAKVPNPRKCGPTSWKGSVKKLQEDICYYVSVD